PDFFKFNIDVRALDTIIEGDIANGHFKFGVPDGAQDGPIGVGESPQGLAIPHGPRTMEGPRIRNNPDRGRPTVLADDVNRFGSLDRGAADEPCQEFPANSVIQFDTGAVIESHDLASYVALGRSQTLSLRYDSLRADARPVITFGFDDLDQLLSDGGFLSPAEAILAARITIKGRIQGLPFEFALPAYDGMGQFPFDYKDFNFWTLPTAFTQPKHSISASIQADLRGLPTGLYTYTIETRLVRRTDPSDFSAGATSGQVIHINGEDSPFGAGWGLAGLQQLYMAEDGSILLVDGDGNEAVFNAPPALPPGPSSNNNNNCSSGTGSSGGG